MFAPTAEGRYRKGRDCNPGRGHLVLRRGGRAVGLISGHRATPKAGNPGETSMIPNSSLHTDSESNPRLTPCEDCGNQISKRARVCPYCGGPRYVREPQEAEEILRETRPVMFRNHPLLFFIAWALVPIGIIWWLSCLATKLTVSNKRSTLRTGLLSKNITEVRHSDVRNVQVRQRPVQRIMGVGALAISSAGQSGLEIQVSGISHPNEIADIINQIREEN